MAETPWNSIDLIQEGIFQDSEIIIKSGNANYRMPGHQFAQAFGGLGITEGTCSTAATTSAKKCTLSNYSLEILPKVFNITFTNANLYGDTEASPATYPTLQIYNSNNKLLGSYPVGDSRGHYAGSGCWASGDTMRFCYANGKFCIQNSDVRQKNSNDSNGYTIYSDGSKGYSVDQVNSALTELNPSTWYSKQIPMETAENNNWVIPLLNITSATTADRYNKGEIFFKRNNGGCADSCVNFNISKRYSVSTSEAYWLDADINGSERYTENDKATYQFVKFNIDTAKYLGIKMSASNGTYTPTYCVSRGYTNQSDKNIMKVIPTANITNLVISDDIVDNTVRSIYSNVVIKGDLTVNGRIIN